MATVKDIAKILASRHKIKGAEAEKFLQQMVEVINGGLLSDRVVKIKGFGTFKLQAVKDRASVNVNTGERVVIEGHDKVTFTPDSVMKEIINKPFAQFETVVIDDDSPLLQGGFAAVDDEEECDDDAINLEDVEQPAAVEEQPAAVEEQPAPPVVPVMDTSTGPQVLKTENLTVLAENVTVVQEENKQTKTEQESKEPENVEPRNAEPEKIEPQNLTSETEDTENTDDDTTQEEMEGKKFKYSGLLTNIAIAVIFFALGYWAGNSNTSSGTPASAEQVQADTVAVAQPNIEKDSAAAAPSETAAPATPAEPQAPATSAESKAPAAAPENAAAAKPAEAAQPQKQEEKPLTQYNSDNRVKTGAYYIIGTDTEVTVKEGQTLRSIAKSYLGPGMECYVEAYNGVKEVKPGQKVKIPKLKMKKFRK